MADCKYQYNGEWYTEAELLNLEDFKINSIPTHIEVQHILNNTGEHSHNEIIEDASPATVEEEGGVFANFIAFKKEQLYALKDRLSRIKVAKKQKDITPEKLAALIDLERQIKVRIEGRDIGDVNLRVKGLEREIAELERSADINAVGYYAEADLKRLEELSMSRDTDDIKEAKSIINFYTLAGTFDFTRQDANPFFTADEIFMRDFDTNKLVPYYRLSEETRNQYVEWKVKAEEFQGRVDYQLQNITTDTVNNDSAVQNTYGDRKFDYSELVNENVGLKDVDWVSMWVMDITQGIASNNGILPQVMFSALVRSLETKGAWARKIEEQIDTLKPEVEAELKRLGYTLNNAGIIGLSGATYQIFKEVTKEGNETGGLIQRFSKEFFDDLSKVRDRHWRTIRNAVTNVGAAINKASEERKKWYRANTIILNPTLADELNITPEAIAYRKSLVDMLGQRGYDEQVATQKASIIEYEAERQAVLDMLLTNEGNPPQLSPIGQNNLLKWEIEHSPYSGVEDYENVGGLVVDGTKYNNKFAYNVLIPRKFKPIISANTATGKYEFADSTTLTGHHNDTMRTIEANPTLLKFYDVMKDVVDTIREHTPYEIQRQMAANTLPALAKTSAEMLADKKSKALGIIPAWKRLMEKLRLSQGVAKQSEISYATIDEKTGQPNYKVNDGFLRQNSSAVKERMLIEKTKFIQNYNLGVTRRNQALAPGITRETPLKDIKSISIINLSKLTEANLIDLNTYLHTNISLADIQSRNLSAMHHLLTPLKDAQGNVTDYRVNIGTFIRNYSLHSVVQSQSFDLPRVAKYFSNMTMAYAARQEALPLLEILKQHYNSIKKPAEQNTGKSIFNMKGKRQQMDGLRTGANMQMEDWFQRVVLDNYGLPHKGIFGAEVTDTVDAEGNVTTNIPYWFSRRLFSDDEKQKIKEINKLISKETNEATKAKLQSLKDGFGKERTATAFFDNLLSWVRTLRLGYNLSSATTNFFEGVSSNMIMAAQGQYFDPNEIFYGYGVIKQSFLKNASFGKIETSAARKNRRLMDKFRIIMDSKNELQKSSHKTYSSRMEWLNPHAINQRIEFINQSPIMIAVLRTRKIKGIAGEESSIWDAMDKNGNLKPAFRTEENIENWENLSGEDYLSFKQAVHKAIVLGHGNYDELRGMMIKSKTAGKALMMFKTWLPMQLYWRFAQEQDDIQSGQVGFKGRYLSYGAATGAVHLGIVAGIAFGPAGLVLGPIAGAFLGNKTKVRTDISMLQQTLEATGQIAKRLLGMPVNFVSGIVVGKKLIQQGDKAFENWVGGKGNFTKQDAANMRANMADIALQLFWLAMILMVKGMFWDDDKTKGEVDGETGEQRKARETAFNAKRVKHNILVNKLLALGSQASMYSGDVKAMWRSTIEHAAVIDYLMETGKLITAVNDWTEGDDIKQTGPNKGKSGVAIELKKMFLPGIFKDGNPLVDIANGEFPMLGFGSQADRVFVETPWHKRFKGAKAEDIETNKRKRATRTLELEKIYDVYDDEQKKAMKEQLNYELPTPAQLRKMEMTRDEYEKAIKENK